MSQRLTIHAPGTDLAPAELPSSGRMILGSGSQADLQLPAGPGIEAVHCTIGRVKGGGWAVKDLGSEAGTKVNGKSVPSARLQAGDVLELGSARLEILAPGQTPGSVGTTRPLKAPKPAPATRSKQPELAGYRIERQLGRGGMGYVFLAEQTSLSRKVALKVLSPKLAANQAFVHRFREEARAAAALNHPNVVTVFDVGEHDGHHYLSMEFMEKACLESRLAELGPIPWREAVGILKDAASGLVYAEARGIVHRDIKPANLMQNEVGTTKIADLGLAVQQEADEDGDGPVQGTPHFIAPEVVKGDPATAQSDLYSLGATAFRLLSGRTPFEGNDAREILRNVLTTEVPSLREAAPGIPGQLAAIVEKLLAKSPAERFGSAQELLQHLQGLDQAPAAAAASGGGSKGLLVGVGVLAILGGGGFFAWQSGLLGGGGEPQEAPEITLTVADSGSAAAPSLDDDLFVTSQEQASNGPTEGDLRVFELQAANALMALDGEAWSDQERIEKLDALAAEYAGTDAAKKASITARALEAALQANTEATQEREARRTQATATLQKAAGLDSDSWKLAEALQALRKPITDPVLAGDPQVLGERDRLIAQALSQATGDAEAALRKGAELRTEGRFDELATLYQTQLSRHGLPEDNQASEESASEESESEAEQPAEDPSEIPSEADESEATSPPGTKPVLEEGLPKPSAEKRPLTPAEQELLLLHAQMRVQLESLEDDRIAFARKVRREDQRALAGGLRAGDDLLGELASLALDAAAERLGRVAGTLREADHRARMESWSQDWLAARSVLVALGKNTAGWRRQTVMDPRGGRPIEATGGDSQGLLLDGKHVEWSAWGAQPAALHQLFNARLKRDWSQEELAQIGTLLKVSAVASALDRIADSLAGAKWSDRDQRRLEEAFEDAREWYGEHGLGAAIEAEWSTLQAVAGALKARDEGNASMAIHGLEEALEQGAATLTVALLSDGSEWRTTD